MTERAAPTSHPLAETFSRIIALNASFYADIGSIEADWFLAIDMTNCQSDAFTQTLAYQLTRYPNASLPDLRTQASFLLGEYSWYVPAVAIGAYLSEHRVPDLSLDNLALRRGTYTWHYGNSSGEAQRTEARFLSGCFAALPDDPAANHPDAIILPDADALREWLRVKLEAHLMPIIEGLHSVTHLSRHALWALAADNCAALFLQYGDILKDKKWAQAEGLAFVKVPGSPLKNPRTDFVTLEYEGHCETFRARGGCCRYYMVDKDSSKCSTCVLHKPAERDQILLEHMAKTYAQPATTS
ncbi:MAG: hypothetical protein GC179_11870 [Anaerolineaceae bacterium]|nr:hypothetical protein [Anaerolineaceae bacterium]